MSETTTTTTPAAQSDEPTITEGPIPSRKRSESRWLLAEHPDGSKVWASLSTWHHGRPRYRYASTLHVETEETRGGMTTRSFGLFDGVLIATQDAQRYSAKGMQAAHAIAVQRVRQGHPSEDTAARIAEMFTRTA